MFTKTKRNILLLLATSSCFLGVASFATMAKTQVEAEEVAVFSMYRTASVRYGEDVGLRFGTRINKTAFLSYVGGNSSITVTFEVNRENNADANEEIYERFTVTEESFAQNDEITLQYSIRYDNLDAGLIAQAVAIPLEAKCYIETDAEPIYAENCTETKGVVQDMRSVASFNVLQGKVKEEDLDVYFGTSTTLEGEASYVSGTAGIKIELGRTLGAEETVYINTNRVDNVTQEGTALIIAEADKPDMIDSAVNYLQIIDGNNNVTAKKLVNETVKKSAEFSALDGDFNVSAIVGEEVTVREIKTVANSAVEGTEYAELSLENNKLSGLELSNKEWTNATVRVTTDYAVYDVAVKAATKIIDDAEDLKVFTVTRNEETSCGTEQNGYYVLTKDIDAAALTLSAHSGYAATYYPTSGIDKGLTGTFDGQGYTISNLTTKGEGLFSIVNCGTIKNVGFINGKVEAEDGYIAFLAHKLVSATLSNVYVQVTSLNGTKTDNTVITNELNYSTLNNVVIEYTQTEFENGENYYYFQRVYIGDTLRNVYTVGASSVTSISNNANVGVYTSWNEMSEEQNDLSSFSSDYWTVEGNVPYWNGFKSEDFSVATVSDGQGNAFNNNVTFSLQNNAGMAVPLNLTVSFVNAEDATDFTITGNKLTKNNSCVLTGDREIALKITAQLGELSIEKYITVTAVLNLDTFTTVKYENLYIEADGTIVGLAQPLTGVTYKTAADGVAIAYTEGKLDTAFLNEKALGDYGSMVAISFANTTIYELSYRYVTIAIDEAEDLKMFTFSKDSSNTNDGYYVLTKDIDASALVLNAHAGFSAGYPSTNDKGLSGTLDGQGYVISNLTVKESGLFGVVNGGTIKNIAFVNGKVADTGYITFFAHWLFSATLSNVYVQVTELDLAGNSTWGRKDVLCNNMSVVNMENVVIECTQTSFVEEKTYSFFGSNAAARTWKNVYLVGASTIKVDKDETTTHKELKVYESTSDLVSAGNDLSGFTATYWDTTSGAPVWKTAQTNE